MGEINYAMFAANKPIREITYEILKDAIISGDILPGERIVESLYAKRYNISRTPIREALRKLEQDGLVQYTVRKGVVVRSLEEKDINEIYILRKTLDHLALEHAIKHITEEDIARLRHIIDQAAQCVAQGDLEQASKYSREIHMEIYRLSQLSRLLALVGSLDEYMDRFSFMSLTEELRRKQSAYEHGLIVDALEKRDLAKAQCVSEMHLDASRIKCIEAYESRRLKAMKDRDTKKLTQE